MARGRIVAAGSLAELASGAPAGLRFDLDGPLPETDRLSLEAALESAASAEEDVRLVDAGSTGRYRLDGPRPTPTLIAALGAWCAERGRLIVELRTAGATLEERYLELTGEPAATGEPAEADR